jgi:UDP-glucuronate decarboxylase
MTSRMPQTILIAGGAGFLGSHLVRAHLELGDKVIVIDNLQTTWKPKNLTQFLHHPRFRFIVGDIIDGVSLREPIHRIYNCACSGSYTSYQYDPVHTVKTNTIGVIHLLELAREKGARFLQTSTSEIYGDPEVSPQPESYRGNVNTLGPRACYDEGKRVAETLCMDYHREYGTEVRIARIFNTYGPGMDQNDGRAVSNFIWNAIQGEPLVVYGDGKQTRSFQYVDDLIHGLMLLMESDVVEPINLGNPGEVTMLELAEMVIAEANSSSTVSQGKSATDDPKRRCPDISRAKVLLGWEPRVPLQEGLQKTIAYFRTVPSPESHVLVFATTYDPIMGPAEEALLALTRAMPKTTFHVVTSRYQKGLPREEVKDNVVVVRVGLGYRGDKFLLPVLGALAARRLVGKYSFRFAWSIMGSYSGLAALLCRITHPDIHLLVTLDDKELHPRGYFGWGITTIYRLVLRKAGTVYVSNVALQQGGKILEGISTVVDPGDQKSFMNKVRFTFTSLLNEQEHKLHGPK